MARTHGRSVGGYGAAMSQSPHEPNETDQRPETPDVGLIGDDQLPEDLQPEQNVLARDPDDEDPEDPGA
jgi:hypothetical protein